MSTSKITIKDVAKIAGVSPSTISRILSDSSRISDDTKKRVLAIINEVGYHPSATASNLVRQKTETVGIVIPHNESSIYTTSFFQEALKGICNTLGESGYYVMIATGNPSETEVINRLINTSRVDAIILLRSMVNDANIQLLTERKFPFVVIGSCLENDDIYTVDNNNTLASYDLTEHLIQFGKKRIALVGGTDNSVYMYARLEGYKKCLNDHEMTYDASVIKIGTQLESHEHGYESMRQLLALESRPDAVMVLDDITCLGVLKAINELKYKIPTEIAVACFNDSTYTRLSKPPLTTISLDFYKLGEIAAQTLLSIFQTGHAQRKHVYVDHQLIIRESSNFSAKVG